jgi:hypothetical protein
MLWKKPKNTTAVVEEDRKAASYAGVKPEGTKTETPNTNKLSPRDILLNKIEQLPQGGQLFYQLPPSSGGDVVIIEHNKDYPGKRRKYYVITTELVNDKPGEKRRLLFDNNKPKVIAGWLLEKSAKLIS